jgi:putative transposase
MAGINAVLKGEDVAECLRRGEGMARRWETISKKVSKQLREGLGDCLSVMGFPAEHRRSLTTTNMLESLIKRLKKRTRVVGVFPNRASCDRLTGAQLMEVHEGWLTEGTAYFKMDVRAGGANELPPRLARG